MTGSLRALGSDPVRSCAKGFEARPLQSLGLKARVKAAVDISFGLGLGLLVLVIGISFSEIKELLMNNAIVVKACVWCGVAFLRGPGGNSSNPNEGYDCC